MKPLMMMKALLSLECEKYRYNLLYSNICFLICTNTNCMYWNKFSSNLFFSFCYLILANLFRLFIILGSRDLFGDCED